MWATKPFCSLHHVNSKNSSFESRMTVYVDCIIGRNAQRYHIAKAAYILHKIRSQKKDWERSCVACETHRLFTLVLGSQKQPCFNGVLTLSEAECTLKVELRKPVLLCIFFPFKNGNCEGLLWDCVCVQCREGQETGLSYLRSLL